MTRTVLSPSGVDMQTDALLRPSLTGCGLTTNRSWLYCATWAAGQENGRGVPGHPDLHLARERTTERAAVRSLAHSRIDKGKILSEGGPLASQATHPPRSRRSGGGPYRKGGTGADCHCRQRDTRVRDGPGRVQDRAQPEAGIVWGRGIHVCQGAPLARLEMRIALEELLARTKRFEFADDTPRRAVYPVNGPATLFLRLG